MPEPVLAIPFVRMDAAQNPNMKINDTNDQQAAYWRSMYVTLSSFRRWNPEHRLQIITNAEPPAWVAELMDGLDVETRLVEFRHRAPIGFSQTFAGSIYLLDAIDAQYEDEDLILVDPDVICIRSLAELQEACAVRCGVVPIDTDPDEDNNGLPLRQAAAIQANLGAGPAIPTHTGGEFMVIPAGEGARLRELSDLAWRDSLARFNAGQPHMKTEEHVLTYAFNQMETVDLTPWVRRVWTTAKVRTVNGTEASLTAWHLPSEKERGFRELFPIAKDRESWFWVAPQDEFIKRAGQAVGLWDRRGIRLFRDLAGSVVTSQAVLWLNQKIGR